MAFRRVIPGLPVSDVAKAVDFYERRLGFRPLSGDESRLVRDDVELRVLLAELRVAGSSSCRVHVDGLTALFEEYRASGAVPAGEEIVDQPWGRSEFTVFDPDRNAITFGAPTSDK